MNSEHVIPQLVLRSWPFPRGSGRLTDRLFRKLKFDQGIAVVETTDGVTMKVMPNDLIGRHIYLTGEFDRSTLEVICAFSEPGDRLLDTGANIGYVSAGFLKCVSAGTVIAVEPQSGVLELLRENLEQFGDRSTVYPFAISNRDGSGYFAIDDENRGSSRLSDAGQQVSLRSGGRLFTDNEVKKLDLVKIDVEGHEEEVIRSCLPHFEKLQPKIILFEDHGDKSAGIIGSMLGRIGYSVFSIRKHLTRLSLRPVNSAGDCSSNDYVAISTRRQIPDVAKRKFSL